jgi:hypothetical protein
VKDSKLRNVVQKVIKGRSLVLSDGSDSGNDGGDVSEKAANELLERINLIPDVCDQLLNLDPALGRLFITHFGISALSAGRTPPGVYLRLFVQVRLGVVTIILPNHRTSACR